MNSASTTTAGSQEQRRAIEQTAVLTILTALSLSHLLNDVMQSLLPAVYPLLKENFALDFFHVGLITLVSQVTASLLQPVVGICTDRRPWAFSMVVASVFTLLGLAWLGLAGSFEAILFAAALVGIGSAIFHPEASRVARLAAGGRYGFAQSFFQVGGNAGTALGPLLAASIVLPRGQTSLAWVSLITLIASGLTFFVGRWYQRHLAEQRANPRPARISSASSISPARVRKSIAILLGLVFSKYIYMVSISSYYTFYLMERFGVSAKASQFYLFVFSGAVAAGTLAGGPVGDRLGFKKVIWVSILGVLPFTLVLPYANLFWTAILTVPIGLILASAFSAIVVYAQELMPSRVGLVAGMFFGFAFGMGGIGAAALGWMADRYGIDTVYRTCAFLPAMGLLTYFLPNLEKVPNVTATNTHFASPELDT